MPDIFDIRVSDSFAAFERTLSDIERDNLPFVTAYALTKTAQDVRLAEVEQMQSAFDRPTRFTLNALQVVPATKTDLAASVKFKEGFGSIPAQRYLGPEVDGGGRVHKSHERALIAAGIMRPNEYAVPTKFAPLDGNGNLPGSTIGRILSDVRAAEARGGYSANSSTKTRRRKWKAGKGSYVAMRTPANRPPAGIYFRLGLRDIRPVILFVRQPSYQRRLPFYDTAAAVVSNRLPIHFAEGWARYGSQRRPG